MISRALFVHRLMFGAVIRLFYHDSANKRRLGIVAKAARVPFGVIALHGPNQTVFFAKCVEWPVVEAERKKVSARSSNKPVQESPPRPKAVAESKKRRYDLFFR